MLDRNRFNKERNSKSFREFFTQEVLIMTPEERARQLELEAKNNSDVPENSEVPEDSKDSKVQ